MSGCYTQNEMNGFLDDLAAKVGFKSAFTPPNPWPSNLVIMAGQSGPAVKWVQDRLLASGYTLPKFGADSNFGSETADAVRRYQAANNLRVDGMVGQATGPVLAGNASAPATPPPPVSRPAPAPVVATYSPAPSPATGSDSGNGGMMMIAVAVALFLMSRKRKGRKR